MAVDILTIANSTIQPWWDFQRSLLLDKVVTLEYDMMPCQSNATKDKEQLHQSKPLTPEEFRIEGPPEASCHDVCLSAGDMADHTRPVNLLNCGLLASLALIQQPQSEETTLRLENRTFMPENLDAFNDSRPFGVDLQDKIYISRVQNQISLVLSLMATVHGFDLDVESWWPLCAKENVFSLASLSAIKIRESYFVVNGFIPCLEKICTPRTLDLAGIGVYISMLVQSVFALAFGPVLSIIFTYSRGSNGGLQRHKDIILAALTQFHPQQCYFIAAVELAAIILGRYESLLGASFTNQISQTIFLRILLGLSGCVPVTFALVLSFYHSRVKWRTILLTTITLALASYNIIRRWVERSALTYESQGDFVKEASLTANLVCGSSRDGLNIIDYQQINWTPTVAVYVLCFINFLACVCLKAMRDFQTTRYFRRLRLGDVSKRVGNLYERISVLHIPLYPFYILAWLLCFANQFYIFDNLRVQHWVSSEWSFGQVVANIVWVPLVVELFYMEAFGIERASEHHYPSGWRAVKYMVVGPGMTPKQPSQPEREVELQRRENRKSSDNLMRGTES